MKRLLLGLMLLISSNHSLGNMTDWKSVADIPIDQCDLQNLIAFYDYRNIQIQGNYARQSVPLHNETIKLAGKANNSKNPLGEQLSVKDRIAFDVNRQRLITISLQQLIESNKVRDVYFLEKLTKISLACKAHYP